MKGLLILLLLLSTTHAHAGDIFEGNGGYIYRKPEPVIEPLPELKHDDFIWIEDNPSVFEITDFDCVLRVEGDIEIADLDGRTVKVTYGRIIFMSALVFASLITSIIALTLTSQRRRAFERLH